MTTQHRDHKEVKNRSDSQIDGYFERSEGSGPRAIEDSSLVHEFAP